MCSPIRLDAKALDLDTLAVLVRHPHVGSDVQAAFSKALVLWTRERVQLVTRRMPSFSTTDRDDLVQEFMMRCLTKHLSRWEPAQSSLSGFLYRRLHGDVVDALRRRITADKRGRGDVDPDTLIDHEHGHDDIAARRHRERALSALDAAVVKLPRRQRAVVRRTLNGESAGDVASSLRVHASTVSRERSAAIVALRAVVDAA